MTLTGSVRIVDNVTDARDAQAWEVDFQLMREDAEDGQGFAYTCTYDLDCDCVVGVMPVRKVGDTYWGGHARCLDHAALERFAL